jgi:hypothetical protein
MHITSLVFFVYPDPMGSEEPSPAPPCTGSSFTPAPGGAKNRCKLYRRARRSQNQFTSLGSRKLSGGVNKLIFKRLRLSSLIQGLIFILLVTCTACKNDPSERKGVSASAISTDSTKPGSTPDENRNINAIMVLPKNPQQGEPFRILVVGGGNLAKAKITVEGPGGKSESTGSKRGEDSPGWRIDDFKGGAAGKYRVTVLLKNGIASNFEFEIYESVQIIAEVNLLRKREWDGNTEAAYSAWINALFQGSDEQASWSALHEVTRDKNHNFLYNYMSIGEDEPDRKITLVMQPDCADNPFFLRAYFAWKLGLPFGYHVCDRGYLGHNPGTGQWVTNLTTGSKTDPVQSFNNFLRKLKDGVHSGTARTALDNENSDYYPVALDKESLRPGTVYADPYGHTLTLIGSISQTRDHPGMLLAVDAQPDGTVGIKRFWKGNFLFNTAGVIGEPGFKAFRPISLNKGVPQLMKNKQLTAEAGYIPFSLQQRKMGTADFYSIMKLIINPKPLDPEKELLDLIQALHEQLQVRVKSVENGEAYFKIHPHEVIPMPGSAAGIFLAGGQWENFSTPNRDLRLLIAMDEVLNYPERKKLQSLFDKKSEELDISYTRSDGKIQKLTLAEILKRRDAFEMAYNPNDDAEIRWGAPENSEERAVCKRHAPAGQLATMRSVRTWFSKRLHPPT